MKITKESKFKGTLSRCEVESLVNPLRDREPTKQWLRELKEVLKHFDVEKQKMCQLAADSNKCNLLGHRYSVRCFQQIIDNFISEKGSRTWTLNAQKTVNDHLDILVDYLSKPEEKEEDGHVPTLRERLEKERAEGKWPSVDERLKEQENNVSKYACDDIQATQDVVDIVDTPHKVHVKRVKKHKKHHKSNNIYITIKIGR